MSPSDHTEILASPEFAQIQRIEMAKVERHKRECERSSGLSFHIDAPTRRTLGEMLDAARQLRQQREAFANSPRGRFLEAVAGIDQMPTYEPQAFTLRGIYARALSDPREPLDVKAIGAALAVLNGIPGKSAREAIDALSELLLTEVRSAA